MKSSFPLALAMPLVFAAFAACATHTAPTGKATPKKGATCDNFAHPCPEDQACIDATCRPKACASDSDCHGSGACLEGWCIARQCRASQSCLGADDTAGTADDGSCIGGVCLPITCLRDPKNCPSKGHEACAWNSDCGSGLVCYDGACTSARCLADKDCLPKMCWSGLCMDQQCDEHKPCPTGKNCVNGLCLMTAATSD